MQREFEKEMRRSKRSGDDSSRDDSDVDEIQDIAIDRASADLALLPSPARAASPVQNRTRIASHVVPSRSLPTSPLEAGKRPMARKRASLPATPFDVDTVKDRATGSGPRVEKRKCVRKETRVVAEANVAQLQEAKQRLEDERRLNEASAAHLRESEQRLEEERRLWSEESAAQLRDAQQRLDDERRRLAEESTRRLEEERQKMQAEAKRKLEEELQRMQAENANKVEETKAKRQISERNRRDASQSADHTKQIKEARSLVDRQRQELEQERSRLMRETEEQRKQSEARIQDEHRRVAQELEQERSRLTRETDEQRQQCEARVQQEQRRLQEEAERHRQQLLEEAAQVAERQQAKVEADRQRLLEQTEAFGEEVAQFRAERASLQREHQALQEAVKAERQKLKELEQRRASEERQVVESLQKQRSQHKVLQEAVKQEEQRLRDAEQRRKLEEKRAADALQKQRTFQTAAALATADHSSDVDPTLTDVKQRAMAKAVALSKKIGSVVLQQLVDGVVGKLDAADARAFQARLASGELLDVQSTSICTPEQENYGFQGGKPYFKPRGWIRCGLANSKETQQTCKDWCVAYHGTTDLNALRIMIHGLKRPGESGVQVAHGQVHSETGASMYLSPSIEYAAFPCYSQIFKLGEEHWAQLVLECRVRPGAFKEATGTLSSNKHWPDDVPIDQQFPSLAGLEWLLEMEDDVVVSALMIREFGQSADPSIYGDLVAKVKSPEFLWTELRVLDARARA